jgi:hypothetical protein
VQTVPLDLGDAQRKFDAPLPDRHGLGLHQPEGLRVALLGADARHRVQRIVQPLPLPLDFVLACSQLGQGLHFHSSASLMFPVCSFLLHP